MDHSTRNVEKLAEDNALAEKWGSMLDNRFMQQDSLVFSNAEHMRQLREIKQLQSAFDAFPHMKQAN
ncbi:hypothetical protein [Xenorhabdus littoralis]|uniref:hypothetical protein n=1 Tax=Xenorhabdus littoralis TaxID=2582835 RepID=UPI0029E8030F|nr:hypothetical protein [Xenorhabdus sp. psl]